MCVGVQGSCSTGQGTNRSPFRMLCMASRPCPSRWNRTARGSSLIAGDREAHNGEGSAWQTRKSMAGTHNTPSIEQQLRDYIAEKILLASRFPYRDETSFLESGIIDSVNLLEILLHIEKVYQITVADHEIVPDNFDSVTKIADFIRRKTGQTSAV
jgi:acyl carrier protein